MDRIIRTESTFSRKIVLTEEFPLEYTLESNTTIYGRISSIGKFSPLKLTFFKKNNGRI